MKNENILLEKEIQSSGTEWKTPSERTDDDEITLIFGVNDSIVLTRRQIVELKSAGKVSDCNLGRLGSFLATV